MSLVSEEEIPDLMTLYEKSLANSIAYYGCLTTNEYGSTYVDPEKCKAKNFDPVKASQENLDMIYLVDKVVNRIEEEKGHDAAQEELNAVLKRGSWTHPDLIRIPPPSITKQSGEQPRSAIDKAAKLINREIKLGDYYVKVIAVKLTQDGIFLGVEENAYGDLIHYEIDYEDDMVPL